MLVANTSTGLGKLDRLVVVSFRSDSRSEREEAATAVHVGQV